MGYATAKVLVGAVEDGFQVIMTGRSLDKVKAAMSEIEQAIPVAKGRLSTAQLDVTDERSIEQAVAFVDNKFGRLDVLVNNAGLGNTGVSDLKKRLEVTLTTNTIGPALVAAAFRPLLLKSQKPYSIYVSSGEGSLSLACAPESRNVPRPPNAESYRASKAALNMLAIQEWTDFRGKGLKTFAFLPGFVRSNLRGTSEEARSGWGKAGDPEDSGKGILKIIRGDRDGEAGQFLHLNGVYPW